MRHTHRDRDRDGLLHNTTHTHTHSLTHTNALAHTNTHTLTHLLTHSLTHTHTQIIHTLSHSLTHPYKYVRARIRTAPRTMLPAPERAPMLRSRMLSSKRDGRPTPSSLPPWLSEPPLRRRPLLLLPPSDSLRAWSWHTARHLHWRVMTRHVHMYTHTQRADVRGRMSVTD